MDLARLKQLPLLATLPDTALEGLRASARLARYRAGQLLHSEGEACTALELIVEGRLAVERLTTRIQAGARLSLRDQAVEKASRKPLPRVGRLGTREIFWPDHMGRLESEVFDGRQLRHGNRVPGPAVIELPYTSIAVGVGQTLDCDVFGNFVLRLNRPGSSAATHMGAAATSVGASAGGSR